MAKVTVKCDACGKELQKFPSLVKERNYCNMQCKALGNKMLFEKEPERRAASAQRTREQFAIGGHPSMGRHHSTETKKVLSDRRKEFYATERGQEAKQELAELRRQSAGKYRHSPETIDKIRTKAQERFKNPECKDKILTMLKDRVANDPDYRTNLSNGVRKYFASDAGKIERQRRSAYMHDKKTAFYKTEEGQKVIAPTTKVLREYYTTHESAFKGKEHSTDTKELISKKVKEAFSNGSHPWIGREHSDASKDKIAQSVREFYKTEDGLQRRREITDTIHTYWDNEEHIDQASDRAIKRLQSGDLNYLGRGKMGVREDIGHFVRSSMEANYARILRVQGQAYEYEKTFFRLSNGTRYVPDFYLPEHDLYIEVKGWLNDNNKEKYKLFRDDYPDIKWKLLEIQSDEWKELSRKYAPSIPEWEGDIVK